MINLNKLLSSKSHFKKKRVTTAKATKGRHSKKTLEGHLSHLYTLYDKTYLPVIKSAFKGQNLREKGALKK